MGAALTGQPGELWVKPPRPIRSHPGGQRKQEHRLQPKLQPILPLSQQAGDRQQKMARPPLLLSPESSPARLSPKPQGSSAGAREVKAAKREAKPATLPMQEGAKCPTLPVTTRRRPSSKALPGRYVKTTGKVPVVQQTKHVGHNRARALFSKALPSSQRLEEVFSPSPKKGPSHPQGGRCPF